MCMLLGWRHSCRCPMLVVFWTLLFPEDCLEESKDWLSLPVGRDVLLIHIPFSLSFSLLKLPRFCASEISWQRVPQVNCTCGERIQLS